MTRARLEQQLPTSAACRLQVDHSFHILRPPGQVVFIIVAQPPGLLGPEDLPPYAHLCFVMKPWLAGKSASSAPLNKKIRSLVRVAFLLPSTTRATSSMMAQLAPSSLAPGPWMVGQVTLLTACVTNLGHAVKVAVEKKSRPRTRWSWLW